MTLPQAIAENRHFIFAGLVFPRGERAAEQRGYAEQGEEIRLRGEGEDMVRLAPAAQVPVSLPAKQRHVLKGAVLGLPVDEIRTGKGILARRRFRLVQAEQLFGVAIRQRPQKDGFDDAEDRGIGTDSDRQRDGGDYREARRLPQASNGVAQILK